MTPQERAAVHIGNAIEALIGSDDYDVARAAEAQAEARIGKDPVYLTRFGKPLDEAIGEAQDTIPGLEGAEWPTCDEGACWT